MNQDSVRIQIIDSWKTNAQSWIDLINRNGIPSRYITNKAIINLVLKYGKNPILDLGCGEGWLTRTLEQKNFNIHGVDGTHELIEYAKTVSNERYYCRTYEQMIAEKHIPGAPYGSIISNYSIFLKDETSALLDLIYDQVEENGTLIIQTVHPSVHHYGTSKGRWIENAWEGLDGHFTHPHPWYARTLEEWIGELEKSRFEIYKTVETISDNGDHISILFVLKKTAPANSKLQMTR